MSIQNVYGNDEASKAQAAQAAKGPELFNGHYVKDGQVQRTWGEWLFRTDISSLRNEYEQSKQPSDKKEEESYFWKPFSFIGGIFSSVLNFVTDLFQKIFFCFDYSEAKENETKKPEVKN